MKAIFKYQFNSVDSFELSLPINTKILSLQVQRATPCIWALVDNIHDDRVIKRKFRIYGTGHPIDIDTDKSNFIGTYQELNGTLVFHLFEVIE